MEKIKSFIKNNSFEIVFAMIIIIAFGVRIYKIASIPYGLNIDEAGMAYDAYSIANFGVDRYLNRYPVYLINFGGGQSALYAYLSALLMKLFGTNIYTIRLPAFLLGMAAVVLSYFIARKNHSKKFALTFMALVAICPWQIMASRFGFDCNLLSPMLIISIFFLTRAETWKGYLLAGILIGMTLYTYALSYIIVPLFLLFSVLYLLWTKKANFKKILIMGIPIFILALPLMLMIAVNNDWIPEIKSFITIPHYWYRGNEVGFSNIKDSFLKLSEVFTHDEWPYSATAEFGTLYYISIPFLIIGFVLSIIYLFKNIKKREFSTDSLFFFAFIATIMCLLVINIPNVNRSNAIYIPSLFFVCIALRFIYQKSKIIFSGIAIAYACFFIAFVCFYFNEYTQKHFRLPFFENEMIEVINYIDEKFPDRTLCIDKTYIYTLLALKVSPYDYNENKKEWRNDNSFGRYIFSREYEENDKRFDKYVYLVNIDDGWWEYLQSQGYQEEQFGSYHIMYK